jgi:hypothetical protein
MFGSLTAQPSGAVHHHHSIGAATTGIVDPVGVMAALMHTLGYVVVTALLAAVVYEKLGLRVLRRAWINLNVLWAGALIVAAVMSVAV